MPAAWVRSLRALHDEYFDLDWGSHLRNLNARLRLIGRNQFGLPDSLPPVWFVGDLEALVPREWALVVSLNQARREEGDAWHLQQGYTRQSYWDYWRFLNRNWWEPRFYRPLARLAANALNVPFASANEAEFATTRMIFVELCPYPSRAFGIDESTLATLAVEDIGFQLAARMRRLLIEEASPALIMVNGTAAMSDFERLHGDSVQTHERRYTSVSRPGRELWHREGHYDAAGQSVPVIGFPFLRKPQTHNSYAEIDQLGGMARSLLRGDVPA